MNNDHKVTVTFVMPSNLRTGGGAEIAVMQYATYADFEKYRINIVQTDHLQQTRFSEHEVKERINFANLYTIEDIDWRFQFLRNHRVTNFIFYLLFRPIIMAVMKHTKSKKVLSEIKDSDVIYLFQNELQGYFKSFKGKVIGHNGLWVIKPNSVNFKLVSNGLMWHRIDGFRLFPFNEKYSIDLKRNYNLVLTNGIDTSIYKPGSEEHNQIVKFLFVGRVDREKGIDIILESVKKMEKVASFEMHIAGIGNMSKIVLESELPNIKYHGMLKGKELQALYQNCDVFVFPTKWEPFGLVILEALSSGLHVLVSDIMRGSFDEFEKTNALEYLKNDVNSFTNAMLNSIEHITLFREMKNDVHKAVEENYDIKVITNKLFDFFSSISEK